MWVHRSSRFTQSTSFLAVLLTRFAQAVVLASAAEAVALALDANTGPAPVTATAAAVATASLQPRRRPCPGLIVMLPYVGETRRRRCRRALRCYCRKCAGLPANDDLR